MHLAQSMMKKGQLKVGDTIQHLTATTILFDTLKDPLIDLFFILDQQICIFF
jgi:hypothetical protein